MARPTKLNKETQERIVKYVRNGAYVETASAASGITKETLYDWLRRAARERERLRADGAKPDPKERKYLAFSDAIEEAQATAEMRDLDIIALAAQPEVDAEGKRVPGGRLGDWHASAWRLERKFPGRYGRREAVTFDEGGIGDGDLDTAKAARQKLDSYLASVAASREEE